jgi:hypothetical protein
MKKETFRSRFENLLNKQRAQNTPFADKLRNDPGFYDAIVQKVNTLGDFYEHLPKYNDALQTFDQKLHEWLKTPQEDYTGFVGELRIADWLRQRNIPHRFFPRKHGFSTPDIELSILDMQVYFEIKTVDENSYARFSGRIQDEISQALPRPLIDIKKLKITKGQEDQLVAKAVQAISETLHKGHGDRIQYKGEEGEFSLNFLPGKISDQRYKGVFGCRPDSRVIVNGIPWDEFKLENDLRDNIRQFNSEVPTLLVWVNYDIAIVDIKSHVISVLEKHGNGDFANVAGIVILDPAIRWEVVENKSKKHDALRDIGLFETIANLKFDIT